MISMCKLRLDSDPLEHLLVIRPLVSITELVKAAADDA